MGYLHIKNLYVDQDILLFKRCFAMEKIHGCSSHVSWDPLTQQLTFFSGGEKYDNFVALFNQEGLKENFIKSGFPLDKVITVYGEVYAGHHQRMSETYGKSVKFITFDVQIGDCWLTVPKADKVAQDLGLEFVYYTEISTDLAELDAQRDADSVQAIRNGIGPGKMREGIVCRPLIELTKNNGERIICKHKRKEFAEVKTERKVGDFAKIKIIREANEVADEFATNMRLEHVLQKIPDHSIEKMGEIIKLMISDIEREGAFECEFNKETRKAISTKTVSIYKEYLKSQIPV